MFLTNAIVAWATEPAMFLASTFYRARGQTTRIIHGNGVTSTDSYIDALGFLTCVLTPNCAAVILDQDDTCNTLRLIASVAAANDNGKS
jgi:hypothetical protein